METHRVLHDFGELNREDVFPEVELTIVERKPYESLFAALAFGFLLGYLFKRK